MSDMTQNSTTSTNEPETDPMMIAAEALATIRQNRAVLYLLTEQINTEQEEQVAIARTHGATWQEVGNALRITRSAAQKRYGVLAK